MNRRKLILAILSIVAASVGVFIAFLKPKQLKPVIQPTTQTIPMPEMKSQLKQKSLNIILEIKEEDIHFPKTLKVYKTINQAANFEELKQIAQNLGYKSDPLVYTDVNLGQILAWYTPGSLRIVVDQEKIDYHSGLQPIDHPNNFDEEKLKVAAKTFLERNGLINIHNIQFSDIKIRGVDGFETDVVGTSIKNLQMAEVKFRESIEGYPIVNTTTEIGTVTVVIDKTYQIIRVFVDKTPKFDVSGDYPVKTYRELIESLNEAEVQSLGDGTIFLSETPIGGVVKIIINRATIGYLQENKIGQAIIQPIFMLEGISILKDNTEARILLYLPALAPSAFTTPPAK